jgi:acetyltransferase-like isoleucine patch superfamily enzyme
MSGIASFGCETGKGIIKMKYIYLTLIALFDKIINLFTLKRKKVILGSNIKINGRICVFGHGQIKLSDNVTINSSLLSNPIGGETHTILNTTKHGYIEIGEGTGISNSTIVANDSVKIGKNVFIGGDCRIYDTDFHSIDYSERISGKDNTIKIKPVEIHDGAFICAHTIILKGVNVGEKSVIGAGSVLTKDVPPYEIWAGNPARFIRKII